MNTQQTLINPQKFEAKREKLIFKAPLTAEPKPPSLVRIINIGQEKKFEPEPKQKWAEVETGGHFVLPEAKATPTLVPTVIEEARPTSEEIDLGIVPQMAGEIVQEDRVENDEPPILQIMVEEPKQESLIKEPIATRGNTEQMQLKELTMGEDKSFNKTLIPPPLSQFFVSGPQPVYTPSLLSQIERSQIDAVKEARIKALDKPKPLSLKQEAEPIISPETNRPLSPENEVRYEPDEEAKKLAGLSNMELAKILEDNGVIVKYNTKNGKDYPALNKTLLKEAIQKLS